MSAEKIILFDGVCNLCNGAINFIIKHDPKAQFKFASLQGETGTHLLDKHRINPKKTDSIILIEPDRVSVKSAAALRISKDLNKGYPLLYAFMIIPGLIRNAVYDFIARNRYKWFGKKESCMIPTPELKSRFLD
ncbi:MULTISPECIES: thiol-disulfide oxidoreductase DCC family protein [unclassified Leeuwenhoekiella]|uniref:thiol-disulfide oxidoreductase DCC family protein n=1 Tax=unclassified Leeuwenhoekiella TaxID=2615029 RepID=UPI000C519125|nr:MULTISPECIES: thiol-disulfide oxidoreductase DCC family protein [unclassified Leeuwenhoekiella]MAW93788.1 thiol-disulfide oxidoreductase [Leeuwenhoekiella sp.]MBA80562.1 thiol-disulfide oxidoreductase [Leeuwenhoekiella sp.]|tara:strand:- start:15749 stop:16150 length:402 start_codon:yes stop_codon:yes gene_type:complete